MFVIVVIRLFRDIHMQKLLPGTLLFSMRFPLSSIRSDRSESIDSKTRVFMVRRHRFRTV